MNKSWPYLALLCACARAATAAPEALPSWTSYAFPAAFTHMSTAQGLSHGTVYCTLQDKDGFLWFGTENGLNRYDGFGYKIFHAEKDNAASLASDWINCLLEDSRGVLWIGTYGGGLNRIDRDGWKIARYAVSALPEGLSTDNVRSLAEDSSGNLWIGTGKGLFVLPRDAQPPAAPRFEFVSLSGSPRTLRGGIVASLHVDAAGAVWAGLEDGGLFRVRPGKSGGWAAERFAPDESLGDASPPAEALTLEEDSQGLLWIGSGDGLYSYDRGLNRFARYVHGAEDPASLSFNIIRRVFRDRAGGLWIATDGGGLDAMLPRARPGDAPRFRHFQHDNKDPASLTSNAIESIYEDRSNVLWVGTYFMGLNKLILGDGRFADRAKRPLIQYKNSPGDSASLSGNMVNALIEDRFGSLWVGTDGYGLNRARRPASGGRLAFEHFRADPKRRGAIPEDVVTGLFTDSRKRVWMTTYTAGLVRVDVASASAPPVFTAFTHDPRKAESLSENFTWAMLEDSRHRYWVATDIGVLDLFDPETGTCRHFPRPGRKPGEISDAGIYALVEDRYGTIWIGTYAGLARFNPQTEKFKSYYQGDGAGDLGDSYVTSLCLSRSGALWIGTNAGGVAETEIPPWDGPDPVFKRYGVKEGLPNNIVMGILEDNRGSLWISTSQALSRFDPAEGRAHPFVWHEELQRTSFIRNAMYRSPEGDLFFAGSNGFSLFRPEDIAYNAFVPPMALTEFKINNRAASLQDRRGARGAVVLSARDYEFSFEFAAMHFVAPDQNRYAYMMEGLDTSWNQSRNDHFIAYTTLPAGDYVFRAKGSNCDGLWGPELSVPIRVLPPWWKTWWFRLAAGTLFVSVIYVAIRLRLRALRRSNRLLAETVAEKTQEMRDILDNVGQGLFTIDLDGKVNPDHSLSADAILHVESVAGRTVPELFRLDEIQSEQWRDWLETVRLKHATVGWKALASLVPLDVVALPGETGPRYVSITFEQMFDRQRCFNKLLVLAQDVTEARLSAERMDEEKKAHEDKVKAILGIVQHAATLPVFLDDVGARIEATRGLCAEIAAAPEDSAEALASLGRETHTVKGTAAAYGFDRLAAAAGGTEMLLEMVADEDEGEGEGPGRVSAQRLREGVEKMAAAAAEIRELSERLTGAGHAVEPVPTERVAKIKAACAAVHRARGGEREGAVARLLELCSSLDRKPVGLLALNYRGMLQRLGERLGKQVDFRVVPEDFEISPKTFMEWNEPVIHLLRNAVDHGLEGDAERAKLGKPAAGIIELKVESQGDWLAVSVSDDGSGIDVAKVCEKALALGLTTPEKLAAMDEAEKSQLVLMAGLTTSAVVGDLSGRGVGMDVVADWVKGEGGRVDIRSRRGQGTQVTLLLPPRN